MRIKRRGEGHGRKVIKEGEAKLSVKSKTENRLTFTFSSLKT